MSAKVTIYQKETAVFTRFLCWGANSKILVGIGCWKGIDARGSNSDDGEDLGEMHLD